MPQRDSGPVTRGDRHRENLKPIAISKLQEPFHHPYEDQARRKQIADDHSPPPPNAEWGLDPPRSDECRCQKKNEDYEELRAIRNRHGGEAR